MGDINWTAAGVIIASVGVIWAGVTAILRRSLAGDFVTREGFQTAFEVSHAVAVRPVVERLDRVEQRLANAPTRGVVNEIERRVEVVEKQLTEVQRTITEVKVGVGEVKAAQVGQTDMMKTQTRQIGQIVTHLLGSAQP
jgi:hypothetical protein